MQASTLFALLLGPPLALSCQPIVIGSPEAAGGGADETPGTSSRAGTGNRGPSLTWGGEGPNGAGEAEGGASTDSAGQAQGGATGSCSLTLSGHVTMPRGAPVIGMTVTLGGEATASAVTSARGDYTFENLCPGSYQITPSCGSSALAVEVDGDRANLDFDVPSGGCEPALVVPRVLLVIYDPTMTAPGPPAQRLSSVLGVDAPDRLALQLFDTLRAASNGHVRFDSAGLKSTLDFPPQLGGFRYTAESFAACLADANDCHSGGIDYGALEAEQALCEAVDAESVDQIWLLGAEQFGLPRLGQLECSVRIDGQDVPKRLDVIGLRYGTGLTGLLADYQAAGDEALRQVFGTGAADAVDNPYGLFTEACGDQSQAPNSQVPGRFADTRSVPSGCDAFSKYPRLSTPLATRPVSCTDWGCSELGFRRYWFAHLPRALWLDARGKQNDFWRYLASAQARLPAPPIAVSCSSSYQPGWCEHVRDGKYGECNSNEWATQNVATGWVEFQFQPQRLVSGVYLYDRACDERVTSGHLEFSDGSSAVTFGELETSGKELTSVGFAPRLLSGLRVFIDSSSGPNPGLGEITVTSATAE